MRYTSWRITDPVWVCDKQKIREGPELELWKVVESDNALVSKMTFKNLTLRV